MEREEFPRAGAVKKEIREPPLASFIKAIHLAIKVKIGCPLGSHPFKGLEIGFILSQCEAKRKMQNRNI